MRVGILGGTFNPIHFGHLRAAEEVREHLGLDLVLFVPSGVPPLKNSHLVDVALRLEMARLATADNPRFRVLDIEARRPGPSYTVDTLVELSGLYPSDELVFMLGADAFLDLHKWKDAGKVLRSADFAVMCRPGLSAEALASSPYLRVGADALRTLDQGHGTMVEGTLEIGQSTGRKAYVIRTTALGISATEIRKRLQKGRSVAYLLPETVKSFIITNALYSGGVQ